MQDLQLYLHEQSLAAGKRIRAKILGAAGFAAVGGTAWAIAGQRRVGRTVPSITANAAIAMATFAVCQESVRAVRHGQHDAWNSAAAGSLAGAVLTRAAYGKGFHLLGLVVWGPVCGALHWFNDVVQPGAAFKYFLASQGLLDLPEQQQQHVDLPQQQQQQSEAAVQQQPRRVEDVSEAELNRWADEIKQRELAQLKELWRQQEQQEAAAALAGSTHHHQQGAGGRRWWRWFG